MPSALSLYKSALGRLGLSFDDGLLGEGNPTSVIAAFNAGMGEMSVDHDWLHSYTETDLVVYTGQDTYDMPTDWLRTAFVVNTASNSELRAHQRREHFITNAQGEPQWYDTSGDKLLIAPTPDRQYTLRHGYFVHTALLEEDTDSETTIYEQMADTDVSIPTPFDQLAILYIARALTVVLKDREAHQMLSEEIKELRNKIQDNRRRQQAPGRINTRRDY